MWLACTWGRKLTFVPTYACTGGQRHCSWAELTYSSWGELIYPVSWYVRTVTAGPFSMLYLDLQPRKPFLRTVSSSSLQRWAHSWACSKPLSWMHAVVLTTIRQEQWLKRSQLDMCSQLQHGAQPRRSFLRTVSSDSLQRWAHSFTKLDIDVSLECCSADCN